MKETTMSEIEFTASWTRLIYRWDRLVLPSNVTIGGRPTILLWQIDGCAQNSFWNARKLQIWWPRSWKCSFLLTVGKLGSTKTEKVQPGKYLILPFLVGRWPLLIRLCQNVIFCSCEKCFGGPTNRGSFISCRMWIPILIVWKANWGYSIHWLKWTGGDPCTSIFCTSRSLEMLVSKMLGVLVTAPGFWKWFVPVFWYFLLPQRRLCFF